MEKSLASSKVVVHNAFYNLLGFIGSIAYLFFLIPLVVGYLGLEQYGLWSLVIALTGYVGLVDLGMGMSFVKFVAEYVALKEYENVSRVVQHGLLFYFAISLLVLLIGYFLHPVLFSVLNIPAGQYDLARSAFFLSLVIFGISNMGAVFGSVLSGIQRMDVYNLLAVGLLVAKFVAIVVVLAGGLGLIGLLVADIVVTLVAIVPLVVMTKRHLPQLSFRWLGVDSKMMRRLLGFGTQLQVARLAELVQLQFDKLLISRYIGLAGVSMYDFGSRPLGRLRAFPLTAIQSLVPAVSALDVEDNPERIHAALLRGTRYLIVVALPMFAFLIVFAEEIIMLWLGNGYSQAAIVLQILSMAYFVNVVSSILGFVSHGKGEPKYQMQAMVIQALLNVILSTALLLTFGFYGAVVGTAIAMAVGGSLFFYRYGKRLIGRPIATFGRLAAKPALSVVPALLLAAVAVRVLSFSGLAGSRISVALSLSVAGLAFTAIYCFMLYWTKTFTADDKGFVIGVIPDRFKHLLRVP